MKVEGVIVMSRVLVVGAGRFLDQLTSELRLRGFTVHRRAGLDEVLDRVHTDGYAALVFDGTALNPSSGFFDEVIIRPGILSRLVVIVRSDPSPALLVKLLTLSVYGVASVAISPERLARVATDLAQTGWQGGTRWLTGERDRSPGCRTACPVWNAGEACAEMDEDECLVVLPEIPGALAEFAEANGGLGLFEIDDR
jgi:hypothetical protein